MKQKFKPGTFVMIAKDLGLSMSHFENNKPAMVQYTYGQMYGGGKDSYKNYSLKVRYPNGKWSSIAWYYEHQLTPIKDKELIKEYKKEIGKIEWIIR